MPSGFVVPATVHAGQVGRQARRQASRQGRTSRISHTNQACRPSGCTMTALQPIIGSRILTLREQRVILDADLAELYGVQTKVLVQAVKRKLAASPLTSCSSSRPKSGRF
jgi:hypothetical protein